MWPVLALATWARLAIFPKVLLGGGVSPANGDSEYHLRRLLLAFESFPRLSVFDPLLGWPAGHAHPWAPGFDWVGAALLHLTFLREPGSLALAAACFPVLLGVVSVWLVMEVTSRLLPAGAHRLTPLAAGTLAALVPQFVAASRLARTDHHVWEALSVLLLLRWALGGLEAPRVAWRFEALGLVAVLVTLSGFVGGPLYLALITPLLLIRPVLDQERTSLWGSGAGALAAGGGLAALINLGPISEHGRALSFGYPSLLQPALAIGAGGVVVLGVMTRRVAASALGRLGVLISGALALVAVGLGAPGLGPQVRGGLVDWLWKKDPWLSGISEFQPLFSLGRPPLDTVLFYLGVAGLVSVPLLLAALALQRERRRALLAFTLVFTALLGLTVLQMRFGRVLAPLLGVACAVGLASLALRLGPRGLLLPLAVTVAVCAADPEVRKELVLADARAPSPIEAIADGLVLSGPAQPGRREGVLAHWELGNTLISRSRRPVIASGFGSYLDAEGFAASARAFASDERGLLEVMSQRDLGLVVTGAATLLKDGAGPRLVQATPRGLRLDPAGLARRPVAVLLAGGSGVAGVVGHAEHLMPTQASEEQVSTTEGPLPLLWSYERVAGASVSAACTPGAPLIAELDGAVGLRPFRWTAWAPCQAGGRAELILCVPSGVERPGFATAPAWRVLTADGPLLIAIDETAIRVGGPLTSPGWDD